MTSRFDSVPPPPDSDPGPIAYAHDDRPESPPDWRDAEIARLLAELAEQKSLATAIAIENVTTAARIRLVEEENARLLDVARRINIEIAWPPHALTTAEADLRALLADLEKTHGKTG